LRLLRLLRQTRGQETRAEESLGVWTMAVLGDIHDAASLNWLELVAPAIGVALVLENRASKPSLFERCGGSDQRYRRCEDAARGKECKERDGTYFEYVRLDRPLKN
jgi:hypothetical protein